MTDTTTAADFFPPAAEGLPAGTLEAAEIGANRLDAWARTPQGRNFLAHALVQLARTGWLRTEPGDGFEPMRDREPADPAAVPSVDRAALRDRIAEALYAHDHPSHLVPLNETGMESAYRESADAVLAVLPPPVSRAAVLLEAAEDLATAFGDPMVKHIGLIAASHLRHRAREIEAGQDKLRRMAAEAQQQPDTEAHPPEHTWAAELYDPLAEEWVPGTRYITRDRAVNHLAHARSVGPTWKDGTPVQRRLVRESTTYTVEQP